MLLCRWNRNQKKKRQKRTIVQSSVCYKKNVAWRGWDRMRLRPYHWWDWLIWILGEGSDRQDRVEIKNGQHDTHRVMFLLCFFCGFFLSNMQSGWLSVSSKQCTVWKTYVLKAQEHRINVHEDTSAQIRNILGVPYNKQDVQKRT